MRGSSFALRRQPGGDMIPAVMEIKPVIQNKKLAYPLVTAAVVGAVALSGCQPQQQQQNDAGAPPQLLGGVQK